MENTSVVEKSADPKIEALKQQQILLEKRMRIYGRAVMYQGIVILLTCGLLMLGSPSFTRNTFRQLLGKPVVLGLLGAAFLVCYGGIRKKNCWFSLGALVASVTAMCYTNLLWTAYQWSSPLVGMESLAVVPVWCFVIMYLFPFSIMLFQLPSFFRWKKLRNWNNDSLTYQTGTLFQAGVWKMGPMMVICLFFMAAGILMSVMDGYLGIQSLDLSKWERYTIPGTEVSMLLPLENRENQEDEGKSGIKVEGDLISIMFMDFGVLEDMEEKQETIDQDTFGYPITEPETGMIGDTEYYQTAYRQTFTGIPFDGYLRSFEVDGREFFVMIEVHGITDRVLKQKIEEIMNTIQIGEGK